VACKECDKSDRGWAQCTRPIVKTGNTDIDIVYVANFVTLHCDERAAPSSACAVFPSYVNKAEPKVYSTYSLGHSSSSHLITLKVTQR